MIPGNKETMICQIGLADRGRKLCQIKTFRMGALEYLIKDLEVIMEDLLWDLGCFLPCLRSTSRGMIFMVQIELKDRMGLMVKIMKKFMSKLFLGFSLFFCSSCFRHSFFLEVIYSSLSEIGLALSILNSTNKCYVIFFKFKSKNHKFKFLFY